MAKKKAQPAATSEYTITVKLGDKTYKGQGSTALAALSNIPKPTKIMNKGIITVEHGNLRRELMFMPVRLKRLFYSSPNFQAIHAKQLGFGLNHAITS